VFGGVPELERALAMIADDEVNHLSYCHEPWVDPEAAESNAAGNLVPACI
jgi:hypothetical protein